MSVARVLLLGGSGLLGRHAAHALVEAGHDVTVLSRGRRGLPDGARTLAADRRDPAALTAALRGGVYDLAVDFLAYDAPDVDAVLGAGAARLGRYVLVSSGQVYLVGEQRHPPSREEDAAIPLMREPPAGTRDHGEWAYGVGKRRAEARLGALSAGRGHADVVLRLPVVQGAGDATRRLWAYLQRLLDGGPLLLPGGGGQRVRFVWAADVARVLVALAGGLVPPGSTYNLAQPDEPTLEELVREAAAILDREARLVACSWEQVAERGLDPGFSPYSGAWCSRPDPALAGRELGFRGSPTSAWLPAVVRAHLEERAPADHPGYARRSSEVEFAEFLSNS